MTFRACFSLIVVASFSFAGEVSAIRRAIADPYDNVCIPQIASGGGWKTTFTITNMDTKSSNFSLLFVNDKGEDLSMRLETPSGPVTGTQYSATLPVNGSVTVETVGGNSLVQGWAFLVHNGLSGRTGIVAGQAVFQQQVSGRPVFEAVVPLSALSERRVRLSFDNTNGFSSGVALVNFDTVTATISGTAYDEKGVSLGTGSFTLPELGQKVFVMADTFPFTAKQRGTLVLSSSGDMMCSLGLRFHPGGAFTSVPPLSLPTW